VRFEVLIAVTMKNAVFWDMILCTHIGMYTDISEEPAAAIFVTQGGGSILQVNFHWATQHCLPEDGIHQQTI
jgi:hypothetical protein